MSWEWWGGVVGRGVWVSKVCGPHESSWAFFNVSLGLRQSEVQIDTILNKKVPNGNKKNMRVRSSPTCIVEGPICTFGLILLLICGFCCLLGVNMIV